MSKSTPKRHIQAVKEYMGAAERAGHAAACRDDYSDPARYRDEKGRYYLLTFEDLKIVVELAERALEEGA